MGSPAPVNRQMRQVQKAVQEQTGTVEQEQAGRDHGPKVMPRLLVREPKEAQGKKGGAQNKSATEDGAEESLAAADGTISDAFLALEDGEWQVTTRRRHRTQRGGRQHTPANPQAGQRLTWIFVPL